MFKSDMFAHVGLFAANTKTTFCNPFTVGNCVGIKLYVHREDCNTHAGIVSHLVSMHWSKPDAKNPDYKVKCIN